MRPKVSIIIRTKNEERWIKACLDSIFDQDYDNFEIIVVDNQSEDFTTSIVKSYSSVRLVLIDDFIPGDAINKGVSHSDGAYIVCLSAHCIPQTNQWLSRLVDALESIPDCAGVYGRQIPVKFTPNIDKRDLLTVFSTESRIQVKDYFFHNANSIFKRSVWKKIPFSDTATNIEDRLWGKAVIQEGLKIIYDADACVYHYHGLNQSNKSNVRLNGIVRILEQELVYDEFDEKSILPDSISPGSANVCLFLTLKKSQEREVANIKRLKKRIKEISINSKYISQVVYASHTDLNIDNTIWIDKNQIPNSDSLGIRDILRESKQLLYDKSIFPYAFCYCNWSYVNSYPKLIDNVISKGLEEGADVAFPCIREFSHIWRYDDISGGYKIVKHNENLVSRDSRSPNLRAVYGQGLFILSSSLKQKFNPFNGKCEAIVVENKDILHRI